jgi:signal transduction histidine kinase
VASILVESSGAVARTVGWDKVFPTPAPRRIAPGEESLDAVLEGIGEAVGEARRLGRPIRKMVETCTGRQRFYAIAAAPTGPRSAAPIQVIILEMTDAFQAGPKEGGAMRQLGHDLKSPLTSMSGAVEMLQSSRFGAVNGQQEKLLKMLGKGIDMMLTLIVEATAPYHADQLKDFIGGGAAGSQAG